MGSLILRSEQEPVVGNSSKLPCLDRTETVSILPGGSVCQSFPLRSAFWALRRHFNCSSGLFPACLSVSLLHCIVVAQGEQRNQRGGKVFKLVPDFSGILSSAVARCLLMFTKIKIPQGWTSKSPRLLDLKDTSEILTVGSSVPEWLRKVGETLSPHWLLCQKCLLPGDGEWLAGLRANCTRSLQFIAFPNPAPPSIPEQRQDIR